MLDTMRKWGGVGLAAPQVGISLRFIVAEVKGMTWVLANPEIIGRGTREVWDTEGCLSIPGYTRMVRRSRRVTVQAMQLIDGQWIEVFIEAKDLLARVLQHEIDHLNGILIKPQG
jgi:peptide deformylase